jgi:tight adherence protein B
VIEIVVRALPGVLIAAAVWCAVVALRPPDERPRRPRPGLREMWRAARAQGALMRALVASIAGIGVWAATGWPVAAGATAAGIVVLGPLLASGDVRARIARLDALASWVRRLADVLASGAGGLEQAIASASRTPPEAIAGPVSALAVRVRTRGLEPALVLFADELGDPAADEVVAALILRTRAGGRGLVDVLDAKAEALAADAAARRDVEADRAKPRTDTRLVITITAVVLAGLVLFARDYLTPFDSLLGQLVMTAIAAVMAVACWWMHLIARPDPKPRLFRTAERAEEVR